MTGFEPRYSGVRSDCSLNCTTTIAQRYQLSLSIDLKIISLAFPSPTIPNQQIHK